MQKLIYMESHSYTNTATMPCGEYGGDPQEVVGRHLGRESGREGPSGYATMAPNVGPQPCTSVGEEWSEVTLRRDTGYMSLGRPRVELSTPSDFVPKTSRQMQPVFDVDERVRTPKNVTFRKVNQRRREGRRSSSSSSADPSDGEYECRVQSGNRRHSGGGSRGGAPHHTPPFQVAAPQDPPFQSGGAGDPPLQSGGAAPRHL